MKEKCSCGMPVYKLLTGQCYRCYRESQGDVFDEEKKVFVKKDQIKPKKGKK